jgi:hypothetical protein
VIGFRWMYPRVGASRSQSSMAPPRVLSAVFALLAACGSRTPLSAFGSDPVPDASSTSDVANGGRGGTGGISGGAGAGQAGAGAGGSGGSTGGSGGSTADAGGSTGGIDGKGGTSGSGGSSGGVGGKGGTSGSGGSTGGMGGKGGSSGTAGVAGRGGQSDAGRADASPPFDGGNPDVDAGCSIACGSGPCPVRSGVPRGIVSRPFDQQIKAIAVSADTLYFGTYPSQPDGAIYAMPLAGGAPTLLVGSVRISDLRLDGDTLYYVSEDGSGLSTASLRAISTTGGLPRDIAQAPQIIGVVPSPAGIYFGKAGSGVIDQVVRTGRDGTGARAVISLFGTLWGFAIDDYEVYVADYDYRGLIVRGPLIGIGGGGTMTTSPEPITSPIVDGDDIVFVEGVSAPDTCRSAVMAISRSGPAVIQRLSPGTSGVDVMGLVRDDMHIYWSSAGVRGAVLRVRKGQIPEIIAADQQGASPPVLGATDVYWIARAGSTYEVRTVPK